MAAAWAQSAPKDGTLNLDEVVVTGTAERGSKMTKSIAISTVDGEVLQAAQPQNAADVLASIPGLIVQSSGGGGNANATVRGLPISAGGSRYLQFQEDGLPVLLFGDIAFGNPDDFLRIDSTLDRVEAVRGGTGSTLGTNSPGGIVNYITKTGEETGGSIGVTTGLGYKQQRLDFNYGGKLTDKTRYFVGGYYDSGAGPRDNSASAIQGGQIKGNITQELDNGYIRFSFKHLSDQQPMYMPAPVSVNSNGDISTVAGIDPRKYTGYSAYMPTDSVVLGNNSTRLNAVNKGMTTEVNAFGFEGELRLGNGWTLSEKFRQSSNTGNWIGLYPGSSVATAAAGTTYASGPLTGQAYTGLAFQNVVFDVAINDLGSTTNDTKLSKTFKMDDGSKLTATGGLFLNNQHVSLTWNFNNYYMQAVGSNAALLKNATVGSSTYGLIGPAFGACCSRDINATYRTTAPYAFLTYEKGALTLDGSLRANNQQASGYYNQASASGSSVSYAQASAVPIDYTVRHNAYSVGANYLLDKNTAVFARISDGSAFNADRIMFNGALSGSTPIPINTVKQFEAGLKLKSGNLSSFITYFDARVAESNYSATTQLQTDNKYKANGLEIEEGYRMGRWRITGGATYTHSNTTASNNASLVGQPANRQAKLVYQVGPGYSGDKFDVGLNIVGSSRSPEVDEPSTYWMPAYRIVNLHASYFFDEHTSLNVGVYNLFNALAYTEIDGNSSARALNGRNARLTLKYTF